MLSVGWKVRRYGTTASSEAGELIRTLRMAEFRFRAPGPDGGRGRAPDAFRPEAFPPEAFPPPPGAFPSDAFEDSLFADAACAEDTFGVVFEFAAARANSPACRDAESSTEGPESDGIGGGARSPAARFCFMTSGWAARSKFYNLEFSRLWKINY
jgi:hypothetical protein